MRLLVACASCKRQFDATGRRPSSRFRCHCGAVVTIPEPNPHDAAVVRCSACGASRQGKAPSCTYCGSDFTLRDRDLHTMCPGCMTRVSDQARFCHHCAIPIFPQAGAGAATKLECPACGAAQRLLSRQLPGEQMAAYECGSCTGLWLDHAAMDLLVKRAAESSPPAEARTGPHPVLKVAGTVQEQSGPLYRPCPECRKLMVRQNFGKRSGVIIDRCQEHGVWFDADELSRVLRWVQSAGLERSQEKDREQRRQTEREKRSPLSRQRLPGFDEQQQREFTFLGGLISFLAD